MGLGHPVPPWRLPLAVAGQRVGRVVLRERPPPATAEHQVAGEMDQTRAGVGGGLGHHPRSIDGHALVAAAVGGVHHHVRPLRPDRGPNRPLVPHVEPVSTRRPGPLVHSAGHAPPRGWGPCGHLGPKRNPASPVKERSR